MILTCKDVHNLAWPARDYPRIGEVGQSVEHEVPIGKSDTGKGRGGREKGKETHLNNMFIMKTESEVSKFVP
jgi:hypothetical protein